MTPPLRCAAAVFLLATGCNLVLGIESVTERPSTGGSGGSAGSGGAIGGATSTGGTGGCPGEESAGEGIELASNGSFESGLLGWANFGVEALATSDEGFCGCASGRIVVPDNYSEIRSRLASVSPGLVHARARIRAADAASVQLAMRIDDVNAEPPREFAPDADDAEGEDGWRLAEGVWSVAAASDNVYAIVVFDGANTPPDTEVLLDCVSYVLAP